MSKASGAGKGYSRGLRWFHSPDGSVNYRAAEPRSVDHLPGRSADKRPQPGSGLGTKRNLTPEGRQRLSEASKRTQAARRLAKQGKIRVKRELSLEPKFYVYIVFRPSGIACYVGKGHAKRMNRNFKDSSNYELAKIARRVKGQLPVVLVRDRMIEFDAFDLEVKLIAAIGRDINGGPLVNLTDGGDGPTGFDEATREKIAAANRGRKRPPFSEETRQRMRESQAIRWARPDACSEETRRKQSESQRKRAPRSAEANKLISERVRDYFANLTDDEKAARAANISVRTREGMTASGASEKISAALAGRTHDETRRAITSESLRKAYQDNPDWRQRNAEHLQTVTRFAGHNHTPESRAKMSASHQRRQERIRSKDG